MAIKTISMDEATEEQLRAYVTNFLNIELGSGDDARTAIARAQPDATFIFVLEQEAVVAHAADAPAGEDTGAGGMLGSLGRDDPKWVLNIPIVESDDNSGKNDVLVGVNGRAWQIKRGVDVTVPHRVVIALDNAIADQVRHDDEGNVSITKAKRFSYQTIERPSAAEIAAWDQKVGAEFCA